MNRSARATAVVMVCLAFAVASATPAAAQVKVVADAFNPPPNSSSPALFTRVGPKVFFTAWTPPTGRELWVTDGTEGGTKLVKDIFAGPQSSEPTALVEFKGLLYFALGDALWRSDGTSAGTYMVKAMALQYNVQLVNAGGLLYVISGSSYNSATQLWVTDGTSSRTFRVRGFWRQVLNAFGHGDRLYFTAAEDSLLGRQLWVSDGTLYGTRIVAPGVACGFGDYACRNGVTFFRVGQKVLFTVNSFDYYEAPDLWETDGTSAGTKLVQAQAGRLLAQTATVAYLNNGAILTKSDGTTAGTTTVARLPASPIVAQMAGSTLFAFIRANSSTLQLWKSDGTPAGTVAITSLQQTYSTPRATAGTTSRLVFPHTDTEAGDELWSSDGTAAGTGLAKDIASGTTGSGLFNLFSVGDYILFSAWSDAGTELWRTDGTAAGTYQVLNVAAETVTGTISGTVRDRSSLTGIADASVVVYDRFSRPLTTTTTAGDGTYRVEKLTTDSYFVRVTANSHVPQVYSGLDCTACLIRDGSLVPVTEGFTTENVDFSLAAGGRFSGVVKSGSGAALANARVTIVNPSGTVVATAFANESGAYVTAPGLPAGQYYAYAHSAPGTAFAGAVYGGGSCATACRAEVTGSPLTATAGSTVSSVDFTLQPYPRIAGRVVDSSQAPLRGISVVLYDRAGSVVHITYTNGAGEYESPPLQPGTYYVVGDGAPRAYSTELWHKQVCSPGCDVVSGRAIAVDLGANATGVSFELQSQGSRIFGKVTDAETAAPVQLTVWLYDSSGRHVQSRWTNSTGHYEFLSMPPGTYYLLAGSQLYNGIDCRSSCDPTTGTPIAVTTTTSSVTIDVAYRRIPNVSGRLTDSFTGLPIRGSITWLRADGSPISAGVYTSPTGEYTIPAPVTPAYLAAFSDAYMPRVYDNLPLSCASSVCPPPAGATLFDPAAMTADRTGVNFALTPKGTVTGTVRSRGGEALSNVSVYLHSTTRPDYYVQYGSSASNGTYTLTAPSSGTYYVVAGHSYDSSFKRQLYNNIACDPSCTMTTGTAVTITEGATTSGIDFALDRRNGSLQGTVLDDVTGQPVKDVLVEAFTTTYSSWYPTTTAYTLADGTYRLRLSGGTYYLRVSRSGGGYLARVYGGATCVAANDECDPRSGTAVTVQNESVTGEVNIRLPKLAVTSITPSFGPAAGGTRVTLTGSNFNLVTNVTFDGQPAAIVSTTATQLVVTTPPGALGHATVTVRHSDLLTHTAPQAFSYVSSSTSGDLNGDFRADIFWRNANSGANDAWLMDGRYEPATMQFEGAGFPWDVQTLADFNGDGLADVFWRNASTGQTVMWVTQRNGTLLYFLTPTQPTQWRVIGGGDFDLDGRDDLFWRNVNTGETCIWFSEGTTFRVQSTPTAGPWQPQAVGDVNGDGRADIIWREPSSGQVAAWLMDGTSVTVRMLQTMPGGWRMTAARDTDGDGLADIHWRNENTGQNALWLMTANSVVSTPLPTVGDLSWRPVGMGDFTGDGRADILWRHINTGNMSVWVINGSGLATYFVPGTRPTSWIPHVAH